MSLSVLHLSGWALSKQGKEIPTSLRAASPGPGRGGGGLWGQIHPPKQWLLGSDASTPGESIGPNTLALAIEEGRRPAPC